MKANNQEVFKYLHHALLREVDTMLHLLQKAIDFTKETNKKDEEVLNGRLAPDMFPFIKQVQVFTDNAAGAMARSTGQTKPSMPDTETTINELIERTNKVRDYILTVNPETVTGLDSLKIKLPWMPEGLYFEGGTYLNSFVMQNTTFHLVVAYSILRHLGVQIGKTDFIGNIEMKSE